MLGYELYRLHKIVCLRSDACMLTHKHRHMHAHAQSIIIYKNFYRKKYYSNNTLYINIESDPIALLQ